MSQPAASGCPDPYLSRRWAALHDDDPQLRIRDAAVQLGATEAQLVATGCGDTAVRLAGGWGELVKRLPLLGRTLALTRNEHAVHERQGAYRNMRVIGNMGCVQGDGIDQRLSLARWHMGFAVREATLSGPRRSLQFFDADGCAVHKIYLTDESDLSAYDALIRAYRSADQRTVQQTARTAGRAPRPDRPVDIDEFKACWDKVSDSYGFLVMLNRFGLSRLQALRLAGRRRAFAVAGTSLRLVLQGVCTLRIPVRVEVASAGVLQIHSGPLCNARPVGRWYSVLDADFNLHIRESGISEAWVVRRPTVEGSISGTVTSLELFQPGGQPIARILGMPRPGIPEDLAWRRLVTALEPLS